MKHSVLCASLAITLCLTACGGYDNDKVKTINEASDLTTEQQEYGLDLYLDFQKEQIKELEENINNIKDDLAKSKAQRAAKKAFRKAEYDNTDAYQAVKDKITENDQEIDRLQKEYFKAFEQAERDLGY